MAHLPLNVPMNARRIITKAIHHSSKPELAIAVAMAAAERGPQAIPPLLDPLFGASCGWRAVGQRNKTTRDAKRKMPASAAGISGVVRMRADARRQESDDASQGTIRLAWLPFGPSWTSN